MRVSTRCLPQSGGCRSLRCATACIGPSDLSALHQPIMHRPIIFAGFPSQVEAASPSGGGRRNSVTCGHEDAMFSRTRRNSINDQVDLDLERLGASWLQHEAQSAVNEASMSAADFARRCDPRRRSSVHQVARRMSLGQLRTLRSERDEKEGAADTSCTLGREA